MRTSRNLMLIATLTLTPVGSIRRITGANPQMFDAYPNSNLLQTRYVS